MTRYGSYSTKGSEEVSVAEMNEGSGWSKKKAFGARLKPLETGEAPPHALGGSFPVEEERQDVPVVSPTVVSPRTSSVRAMALKFEQVAASREEARRRSFSVGSPLSERKKLLQKSLPIPLNDLQEQSEVPAQTEASESSTGSKDDNFYEKKPLLRSKRGRNILKNRQTSRFADRLKMFENKAAADSDDNYGHNPAADDTAASGTSAVTGTTANQTEYHYAEFNNDMGQEDGSFLSVDCTTMSAPTVFILSTPVPGPHSEQEHGNSANTTVSESELSTLDYSIFSDETFNVREEVDAMGRLQHHGSREMFESSYTDDKEGLGFETSLSPHNSFNDALNDIEQIFEEAARLPQSPPRSPHSPIDASRGGNTPKANNRVYECEPSHPPETHSPVSKGSFTSRDTVQSKFDQHDVKDDSPFDAVVRGSVDQEVEVLHHDDDAKVPLNDSTFENQVDTQDTDTPPQDDVQVPFDEAAEARPRQVPILKGSGSGSPSQGLLNASFFSTVEQEDERSKDNEESANIEDDTILAMTEDDDNDEEEEDSMLRELEEEFQEVEYQEKDYHGVQCQQEARQGEEYGEGEEHGEEEYGEEYRVEDYGKEYVGVEGRVETRQDEIQDQREVTPTKTQSSSTQRDWDGRGYGLHDLNSLFNSLEEGSNDDVVGDTVNGDDAQNPADSGWPAEFNYTDTEDKRHQTEKDIQLNGLEANLEAADNGSAFSAPAARRYEMSSEKEQQPIKGILKNKMDPLTPNPPTSASPVSSASWYSSSTSVPSGGSEISQQHSQTPRLAVPILPTNANNNRYSIGACVNAHLAENPPEGVSEVSSQCSSPQPPQNQSSATWQEKEDGSVASRSLRNQTGSPCSMDPQFSRSNQEPQQDFDEMAQAVTTMAKTASTAVLDALVDTADKIVVAPLLSIFNCVDQSESILCQGASAEDCWGSAMSRSAMRKKRSGRRKYQHSKRATRKFKA